MTPKNNSELVKHNTQDYGVGVVLSRKTVVYTSDMITDDQWVYTVFWSKLGKSKNHFHEELEDT
tara:strand:+ start:747 stop:938 length:192 start_codon:yes stop_codon:yes gene_type:complete